MWMMTAAASTGSSGWVPSYSRWKRATAPTTACEYDFGAGRRQCECGFVTQAA